MVMTRPLEKMARPQDADTGDSLEFGSLRAAWAAYTSSQKKKKKKKI
jgi:hypothetical protein